MECLNRRTGGNSGVGFDFAGSVLGVGARTAVLEDVFDRTQVLHTYFDLVAEQRSGPLADRADLRDRDLVSLSRILDLPADELDRYIDRELARFVANTNGDATTAAAVATTRRRHTRRVILIIALVALAAGVATAGIMAARSHKSPAAPAVSAVSAGSPVNGTSRT
jgi:hypothetical protein